MSDVSFEPVAQNRIRPAGPLGQVTTGRPLVDQLVNQETDLEIDLEIWLGYYYTRASPLVWPLVSSGGSTLDSPGVSAFVLTPAPATGKPRALGPRPMREGWGRTALSVPADTSPSTTLWCRLECAC